MKKNRVLVIIILLLAVGVAGLIAMRANNSNSAAGVETRQRMNLKAPASHETTAGTSTRVPAYQSAEHARHLRATLDPTQFFGKARRAYEIAKKIPATLAQLPCYCHCDRSLGHKSLYTCFEDDHASHCAVCVDEALLAYQLQKEETLTPSQVRDRIVEKYSAEHNHSH
jgi:hypothetical protein